MCSELWVTPKELSRNDLTFSLLFKCHIKREYISKEVKTVKEKYTKEEFYNEIKDIHDEFGYINTEVLKNNIRLDLNFNYYLHKYGGLKNISKELGLNYVHALRSDKEDVKRDFYDVYKRLGYINIEAYLKCGKYSKQAIKTAFGCVNNLMKELNIPLNTSRMENEDVVLHDIKKVYEEYQSTSSNVYRKHGLYSECVINRIFGTWENAVKKLGLESARKCYGKDEIDRQVKAVFNRYGFISRALIDDECDFTYQALKPYYKNKNEVSYMLGVKNAFCDKLSSKAEVIYLILKDTYPDIIKEKTWDWLTNPKTNKPLWIDFYIPSVNTAIEFDGAQHFQYIERFHKTYENYIESVYRDRLKDKLLVEHGIRLIRLSYKDKITKSFLNNILNSTN